MKIWAGDMAVQGLSLRTVEERLRIVAQFASTMACDPVRASRDQVSAFMGEHGWSAATRATYWSALRSWFGWLVHTGRRQDDPTTTLRGPKVPKWAPHPITTADLVRLLAQPLWHSTKAMILLAAYAGLRVHEVAKVRGEDIQGDVLRVQGKGGRVDYLPLHPVLVALSREMPKSGWWFPSPADPRVHVDRASVSAVVSRAMRRAGIVGTAHSLRHWYGTELVRAGVDLRTTQTLLRHESLATTAIYTRIDDGQRRAGVARLPAA